MKKDPRTDEKRRSIIFYRKMHLTYKQWIEHFCFKLMNMESPVEGDTEEEEETLDHERILHLIAIRQRKQELEDMELNKHRKNFILKYSDPMRERWDYSVMILSIYNSGWLPYEQAFIQPEHCVFSNLSTIEYMNYSIDVIFLIDIVFNFNTTYLDPETNEEKTKREEIFWNYLTGMFAIDLLATIPIYEFFCISLDGNVSKWVQMLATLKLVRVFRLQRVITYMNTTDDVKLSLQLLKTFIFLCLFIHFTACIWFYIANEDQRWVPGQTKLFGLIGSDLYADYTPFEQLTICLYTSILALCGNEIYPITETQYWLSTFILVGGSVFNAYMFGNIAVILQTLTQKSQ